MENENFNTLSARIAALTIVSSQILSLYLMNAKNPTELVKHMQEAAEKILAKMCPEIQDEGKKVMNWIFVESRRAAQQSD